MNIPSAPVNSGQTVTGKVSWFGGPHDPSSGPTTASGASVKVPGIAVYNRATLGGYWKVTAPNGKSAVLKQTDLGPAPFTGRKVDVTYSALGKLGYNEDNFPTNSVVKATFLGKNVPAEPSTGATTVSVPTAGTTGPTFNESGYKAAVQHAAGLRAAGALFSGQEGGGGLLREVLDKAGTTPNIASFEGTSKIGGEPATVPLTSTAAGGGSKVLGAATSQLGTPYVWGGEQEKQGFDCSGLAQFSYKEAGIAIPRTAEQQFHDSTITNKAVPGSLIFFGSGPNNVTHVEIVAGNGKMIGADHTGTNVRYESLPAVGSQWGEDKVLGIGVPKSVTGGKK